MSAPTPLPDHVRIAVVGSGFAGLGAAIRLRERGEEDFVVLERSGEVGGTWRDNSYPGAACDVPSHLYSFSFAPNPDWSRSFSPQPEIQAYLQRMADRYAVRGRLVLGCELTGADWQEDTARWQLSTSRGRLTADFLIMATGALSDPAIPRLPGLDRFAGTVFHSATWDHEHELAGERVAVVGTGASAIQFVPQIQPDVARLHLFQRTPPWVMPRRDRRLHRFERRLYRRLPALQQLVRAAIYWGRELFVLGFTVDTRLMRLPAKIALRHLERQVPDPELRAKLTPAYTIGCKRILISNDYYPSLTRPNVEVVTDGIREVRPHAIVTDDGTEREVDTIIFGTGFQVTDLPVADRVRGRDGVTLAETWSESMQAHLGTTIAGFPNLFLLVGPNTGLGHSSQVFMIEAQIAYVMDALRVIAERGAAVCEVRADVQSAYNERVQRKMARTVWSRGGCASWYLDKRGRNTTLWPGATWAFRRRTATFEPADYTLTGAPARVPVETVA